jgi:SET domain-containing protein 6
MEAKLQNFIKWMKDNGFNLNPKLELKRMLDERGHSAVAIEKIKKGEVLFRITPKMVLSVSNSELYPKLFKKMGSRIEVLLPEWNALILTMMWESTNPKSRWRPYLDLLPESLETPAFWTESDLEQLKGTSIYDSIGLTEIRGDYDRFIVPMIEKHKQLFDANVHTFDLYKRTGSLIMAYSFSTEEEVAMMPMADMLNHRTGFNNARLMDDEDEEEEEKPKKSNKKNKKQEEEGVLKMTAIKVIEKDDEIYNTYGDLGTGELLRKYGFVEENNPFDSVDIEMPLIFEVCKQLRPNLFEKKLTFLTDIELVDEEGIVIINNEELVPDRLRYLCSLFNSTQEEFEQWMKDVLKAQEDSTMHDDSKEHKHDHEHTEGGECCANDEDEGEDDDDEEMNEGNEDDDDEMDMSDDEDSEIEDIPITTADQKGVAQLMLEVLAKRLALYSTTLEEDEIQLTQLKGAKNNNNSTPANSRLLAALVVRISEKRLLKAAVNKISSL